MKLMVTDRLALIDVLPQEGNFLTLATAGEVRRAVEFGSDEQSKLKLKKDENGMSWDAEADSGLELVLNEAQRAVVVEALQALDKAKKLKPFHLPLYRMVVLNEASE